MPPLTLNQAAKAAHKAKSTLLDAIRSGRLSASRNDLNQWQIDPAELFRVYPVPNSNATSSKNRDRPLQGNQPEPHNETTALLVKEKEERERERHQMQLVIDDLRKRLDDESNERRKLTALLTNMQTGTNPEPNTKPLWFKWFGG